VAIDRQPNKGVTLLHELSTVGLSDMD